MKNFLWATALLLTWSGISMGWASNLNDPQGEDYTGPGVTIETPAQGSVVRAGETIFIKMRIDSSLPADSVSAMFAGPDNFNGIAKDDKTPFELELLVPKGHSGPLRIVCLVHPVEGGFLAGGTVTVQVVSSDSSMPLGQTIGPSGTR